MGDFESDPNNESGVRNGPASPHKSRRRIGRVIAVVLVGGLAIGAWISVERVQEAAARMH